MARRWGTRNAANRRLYQRRALVRQYARKTALYPAEAAVLARYGDEIRGEPVLELGCGAGRLTGHVAPLASSYVGVDVSPHMVAYCRTRFAEPEFLIRDMRDLGMLADGAFRTVFGIANVLDVVDHADRLRVLGAIHRLLGPAGLFVFSSHNRTWEGLGMPPQLELTRNPVELVRRGARYLRARIRHRLARRHEQHTRDYAVVTDPGHEFGVLHYYIARATQARQLAEHGFVLLAAYDATGSALTADADDREFPSILYVARRA